MTYAFEPAPLPTLAIVGSDARFPVNRIFCVGRNYAAHAREMGQDEREPPFFFMKPGNAAVDASREIRLPYPPMTTNLHHEIELVNRHSDSVVRDSIFLEIVSADLLGSVARTDHRLSLG